MQARARGAHGRGGARTVAGGVERFGVDEPDEPGASASEAVERLPAQPAGTAPSGTLEKSCV